MDPKGLLDALFVEPNPELPAVLLPKRLLPDGAPAPKAGLFAVDPNKPPEVLVLLAPNGDDVLFDVLLAPNPPNADEPLLPLLLPNRPPPEEVFAPNAGLLAPNGDELDAPNPDPVAGAEA